jgi:ribonuclease-3
VTAYVFGAYPDLPEGQLAQLRASVVNSAALAEVADEVGLGPYLLLGKGEDASSGREKPTILADALEAVIGAVYLDGGWEAAAKLVMKVLGDRISEAAAGPGTSDYKTRLQELAARNFEELPRYEVQGAGPDHAKSFTATVLLGGRRLGTGHGRSKKQAEQAAAREAWATLAAEGTVGDAHQPAPLAADDGSGRPAGNQVDLVGSTGDEPTDGEDAGDTDRA